MEELFAGNTLTTFGYLKPKGDILTKIKQQIDTGYRDIVSSDC